jgi:tetratricopeptide (TPR) repeat protein
MNSILRQLCTLSAAVALMLGANPLCASPLPDTKVAGSGKAVGAGAVASGTLLALHGTDDPEQKKILNDALAMMRSQQPQAAVSLLQQGLMQFPRSATMHFELGNAFSDCHQFQDAINEYQIALKTDPPFPEALLNIAYAYCNGGQNALAIPWFQRFLNENPNSPRVPEVQSQMLMAQAADLSSSHRYDAKKLLEQAIAINPNDTRVHFKMARIKDELGDTQGAINEYEQVLAIQPNHSAAVFNIAGCYQSLGQPDQAIRWFKRYLQNNPNAPDAQTVQNMIVKLKEKEGERGSDPQQPDYYPGVLEKNKCFRWTRDHLPLRVYVQNGYGTPGFRDSFARALFDSFSEWSKATQNRVVFAYVPQANQADIDVSWTGDPYDIRQSGSDVEQGICLLRASARSNEDFIRIDHATVRILTLDRETHHPLSDDDMKKTCLHELGHALGLHGHSTNNHDIMFFSVSPTVWPVLSKRDKATIMRIYEQYPPLMVPGQLGATPPERLFQPAFQNVLALHCCGAQAASLHR